MMESASLSDKEKTVCFQILDKPTDEDVTVNEDRTDALNVHPMTTRKEIWSWYLFDWANSPHTGIILSLVFPVYLTILAQRFACLEKSLYQCDYLDNPINDDKILRISLFFNTWELRPASYAAAMIALSSFFQAVAYILFGALADYSSYQAWLFRITSTIGALFNITWIFIDDHRLWEFAGWWGAISVIFFGLALIFYNGYLPQLVDNHWQVKKLQRYLRAENGKNDKNDKTNDNSDLGPILKLKVPDVSHSHPISNQSGSSDDYDGLELPNVHVEQEKESQRVIRLKQIITDDISQWGFSCGFAGSVLVTCICVIFIFIFSDTTQIFEGPFGNLTGSDKDYYDPEFWVKPVLAAKIIFGSVTENNNGIDNITTPRIFGIQLLFEIEDINLNGSYFGANISNMMDYPEIFTIYSEMYVPPSDTYISQVNLYLSAENEDIIGIQFVNDDDGNPIQSKLYSSYLYSSDNINSSTDWSRKEIAIDDFDNFILGGYQVYVTESRINSTFVVPDSDYSYSYISGFEFLFMSKSIGQYGSTLGLRLSFVFVGVWWLFFSLFSIYYLKTRPKQAIPNDKKYYNVCTISTISFGKTFEIAFDKYPNMLKFLIAYFLYSDAVGTISSCGILFAIEVLNMSTQELILLLLETEASAVIGAFFFVRLQKHTGWDCKQMLLLHLTVYSLLPLYAILGIINGIDFGLVYKWEMYLFVFIFGFNVSSLYSFSRSMFSYLIPVGMENQFFSLYEITDKGSSWIGPLMVAFVSNVASMRWALFYVFAFFVLSVPIIVYGVDLQQGMKQAGKLELPNMANNSQIEMESQTK